MSLPRSPLLTTTDPEVFLHFQIQQGGGLTSPELDEHNAKEGGVDVKVIEARKDRMKQLRALLAANPLPGDEWTQLNCAMVHGETSWNSVPKEAIAEQDFNKLKRQNTSADELRKDASYQAYSNIGEYAQRAKAVEKNITSAVQNDSSPKQEKTPPSKLNNAPAAAPAQFTGTITQVAGSEDVTPMRGVWLGGELFLLRQLNRSMPNPWGLGEAGNRLQLGKAVQGVWINSGELRKQLLAEVADLLPQASLVAAVGDDVAKNPLTLVSFPFRLERNEVISTAPAPAITPFSAPLKVGWAAVLLAVLTTSLLVRGIMRLSERRASFVSAVTHELRTPLTTFRLYSDMLETGAVKEEKRGDYLRVLSREADRLSHLVENVLAFSRIERGNARSQVRDSAAGDLLEQSQERLEARLATAGLTLEMDSSCPLRVRMDTAAVEHILFNLIDNAAKYAAASDPPVVKIHAREAGRFVEIVVSDHGPGIPAAEHGRIFRAFHKSAREAAESKPGVGLGLALSRRLAREQGGDLLYSAQGKGACFILRLPRA